eukprot:327796-Lingulodinium_polyedra.AAC.1
MAGSFRDILNVATEAEKMKELEWAIGRPKSKAHGLTIEAVLKQAASTGCSPFDLAQTQKEDEYEL